MLMEKKRKPCTVLLGMQTGVAIVKNSMEVLKTLKIELPYDPVIPLLGIYSNNTKTLIWKYICTPMFMAALFKIAKLQKQPVFIDRWIRKECMVRVCMYVCMYVYMCMYICMYICVCIYNGILLNHWKEWNLPVETRIDLESIC